MAQRLSSSEFKQVVALTPLVAIDLLVRNEHDELLVGMRVNPPAKGFWFVPGGRVLKNETLATAFQRLTLVELGTAFQLNDAQFQGLYDHIYEEDFTGATDVGTHYVVLAHTLRVKSNALTLPDAQHNAYRWVSSAEALLAPEVHANTKAYCT